MYRRHFGLFVGIAAVPQLLAMLLTFAGSLSAPSLKVHRVFGLTRIIDTRNGLNSVLLSSMGGVIGILIHSLWHGAIVLAVAKLYLGHDVTIIKSLRQAWARIGTMFAAVLFIACILVAGFMALVIPSLFIFCRLLIYLPPLIIERTSARGSLSRSWNLTKGYAGRSFVLLLIEYAMALGLTYLLNYPIRLALGGSSDGRALRFYQALQLVSGTISGIVVKPFFVIACTIFYFDLRVRKEGFDLQLMMDPAAAMTFGQ